jgi:multidrug resistance efflux pump
MHTSVERNAPARIATPLPLLAKRVRYQFVPIVTFLICAGLAGWLWSRQARSAVMSGEVNVVRVGIESKHKGMLEALPHPVNAFDTVKAGQVIARLDTTTAETELQQMEQELAALTGSTATTRGWSPELYRVRIEELRARIRDKDIKSPVNGTVVEVLKHPGQEATPGKHFMTVAAARGEYIVGYLRQGQALRPVPGMMVDVRARSGGKVYQSWVQSVGPQIEPIPPRHLRKADIPEWGFLVQVALPAEAEFTPGEMLELTLRPKTQ